MEQLKNMRENYGRSTLERSDLLEDPFVMTENWIQIAVENSEVKEANAFYLSTVDHEGQPSSRTLLLKGADEDSGYIFYSNYHSRKGQDIELNPRGAMLFYWPPLERQLRIEGTIFKIDVEDSVQYFQSRPKGSQLGAWASPQSEVIQDRSELEDRLLELQDVYQGHDVLPKPPHWGGYVLTPHYFEFWQGRENRLHDRFRYTKSENKSWQIDRLAP